MSIIDWILLTGVLVFTFWLIIKSFFSKHGHCGSCSQTGCQLKELKAKLSKTNGIHSNQQV